MIFPRPFVFVVFGAGLLAEQLLSLANLYKVALNAMPITALDIQIVSRDPHLLLEMLGIGVWVGWSSFVILAIILVMSAVRLVGSLRPITFPSLMAIIATSALTINVASVYSEKIYQEIKNPAQGTTPIWSTVQLFDLLNTVGPIPFLIYTWKLENESASMFFSTDSSQHDIPDVALAQTYEKHFNRPDAAPPNIVLIHLESIFNPNLAFELNTYVKSSLFEANPYTRLVAPMRVNIVGGGSWVSEFESITGLDSRLFGYSGYYTHVSIGPYVDGALPNYLKAKGYATSALVAMQGAFYNSRSAFHKYGFDDFWDWKELELSRHWLAPDTELADAFDRKARAFDSGKPFFSYLLTVGAHAPYPCHSFEAPFVFSTRFKSSDNPEMNCELNEYLLLLENSEKAVAHVLETLKSLEQTTGRPFVLMVYGDHQPFAFTSTWQSATSRDYDGVRTVAPKNQTFMHLMSSTKTTIRGFEGEAPISLLPTLLSAFVADDAASAYLPSSVYLYDRCGSDLFLGMKAVSFMGADTAPGEKASAQFTQKAAPPPFRSMVCQLAQTQTITNQRRFGIISRNMK